MVLTDYVDKYSWSSVLGLGSLVFLGLRAESSWAPLIPQTKHETLNDVQLVTDLEPAWSDLLHTNVSSLKPLLSITRVSLLNFLKLPHEHLKNSKAKKKTKQNNPKQLNSIVNRQKHDEKLKV